MNPVTTQVQARTGPSRHRVRGAAASVVALGLVAAAAAGSAPAEAATGTYTALSLSVVVNGTSVTAKTTVKASRAVQAQYYGVCARSSSGTNVDFAKVSTTISTVGTAFTSSAKTFAPGTYTYQPCLYADGAWTDVGVAKSFTVGAATAAPQTTPSVVVGNGKITLRWTEVPGATGYQVGRGGVDTSGFGAWSTTDPAAARSRVFDQLVNGKNYTLFVEPVLSGGVRRTISATPSAAPTTPVPTPSPTPTTPAPTPTPTPTTPPPTTPGTAGQVPLIGKSKLPWNSVVFGHGGDPAGFESWRKRPVDGVLTFPARNSWNDMGQLPSRRAGDLMIYSIPTFPEGIGGSNAKVAAGNYDSDIRALATKMKNAGWNTDRTVIRLGWENNGNWYQWGQDRGGSEAYKAAFRRFVTQSRAAGLSNVKWDWNLNKGPQAYNAGVSWTTGYPGDDVVDVIGLDAYDMWNPSFTDAQWEANMMRRNPGLQEVADFARSHKKQMALDEWGVVHDAHGGGDNPFYMGKMFGWLKANADVIAWENTYDHDGAPSYFNHKLSDGGNPKAAAQYRLPYPQGWGG
ncbi:hypothetical protein GCM10009616_07500 [Microlunatus lacustris]